MKFAGRKNALNLPVVYSTDRSKAVIPVLVLLFVALWFILRSDLFLCLALFYFALVFSILLSLRLPRFGKRGLILVFFVRLFDLRLFRFVCFLFFLVSGKAWEGLRIVKILNFVINQRVILSLVLKIITDSRIRSVISKGPKYRFPAHIDFNKCRETITSALNDYCTRWCKRQHVESNALNICKLKIFKLIDKHMLFYSNNLDLLSPKPKLSFRI